MTGLLCCTAQIGTKLLINDTSIKFFFNKKDIPRRKKKDIICFKCYNDLSTIDFSLDRTITVTGF